MSRPVTLKVDLLDFPSKFASHRSLKRKCSVCMSTAVSDPFNMD